MSEIDTYTNNINDTDERGGDADSLEHGNAELSGHDSATSPERNNAVSPEHDDTASPERGSAEPPGEQRRTCKRRQRPTREQRR